MANLELSTPRHEVNTDASIAPGVLVYVTDYAAHSLEQLFSTYEHLNEYLNNLYLPDDETGLYHLVLPDGIYSNGWGHVVFHGNAVFDEHGFVSADDQFYIPYSGAVRIEGNQGEVWQNWDYDQSGNLVEN